MLAQSDVTVLIRGETGTGKELAAQAIHKLSRRGRRNLITVNCPALPETILESELFGYRKGAFTHAIADHAGMFDEAKGSSIFLDEIGDLTLRSRPSCCGFCRTRRSDRWDQTEATGWTRASWRQPTRISS